MCEDAIGYRMLIRRWLEDTDVDVVGEATTWAEADRRSTCSPTRSSPTCGCPRSTPTRCPRLRAAVPDASIVSLSGLSADEAERLVGGAGVIDLFLSKRQSPADIVEALRAFVQRAPRGERAAPRRGPVDD